MNLEIIEKLRELTQTVKLSELERVCADLPQEEAPVSHFFAPGIYIREIFMKANSFIIGHTHKFSHYNELLTGSLVLLKEDGNAVELKAPFRFVSPPGKKVLYIIEDCIFRNIYATEERDLTKIEEKFIEKGEYWQKSKLNAINNYAKSQIDVEDFNTLLDSQKNIFKDFKSVEFLSENYLIAIHNSPINGKGIFATSPLKAGTLIGCVASGKIKTPLGVFLNHAKEPNCRISKIENGDYLLYAIKDIEGNLGGQLGEELTIDYKKVIV